MTKQYPSLIYERELSRAGHSCIAGLDEAGRGAWAGPVAAAAVILPLDDPRLPERLRGVCDSKLCTPRQRETLYVRITEVALAWSAALVPASRIDETGIMASTRQAMRESIAHLAIRPDALLIDAVRLPTVTTPQCSLNKGDLQSLTIAAASIVAKVTRDRAMVAAGRAQPGYGFARHKGYGTRQHRRALYALGPLCIHRWSFAPVAEAARQLEACGRLASPPDRAQAGTKAP